MNDSLLLWHKHRCYRNTHRSYHRGTWSCNDAALSPVCRGTAGNYRNKPSSHSPVPGCKDWACCSEWDNCSAFLIHRLCWWYNCCRRVLFFYWLFHCRSFCGRCLTRWERHFHKYFVQCCFSQNTEGAKNIFTFFENNLPYLLTLQIVYTIFVS